MHHLRPLIATIFALAFGLTAQGNRNVELMARFDPQTGRASDVWGYVDAATGREYALYGTWNGTHIVDCSDPRNPMTRGMIPTDSPGSSGNRWVDIKTYGSYAYIVSEAYGGMQIVDLRNPDLPVKVKTWGAGLWSATHNLAMDVQNGVAYACGTNSGVHVIDVRTDPENPTRIARLTSPYVHDMAIQDGLAHAADINGNRLRIYDVTGLPAINQLSSTSSAGKSSCHSMWPSRDNQVLAVCHETSGGEVVIYDISNPRLPRFLSKYQTGGRSAIVHNPMIADRVCHVSWNTEGYQALDVSNPREPVRVGYYDTWGGASSGFEGMWGIFAVQPSGVIYGGDRTSGLYILKPKATARHFGSASAGNSTPTLHTFGAAWIGNSNYSIDVAEAEPNRTGVVAVSLAPASQQLQGLEISLDFSQSHAVLPVITDAQGGARVALPVANDNSLVGSKLYFQAFVRDAAGPLGLSASRGMEIEVFRL